MTVDCPLAKGLSVMSEDLDLEMLRRWKMLKLMNKMAGGKVLGEALKGRAWEVLEVAERQFPEAARQVKEALARLVSEGKFKGPITGEQLLHLFRSLGLNVRLQTEIKVLEDGG